MKKLLFVISLFSFASLTVFSQENSDLEPRFDETSNSAIGNPNSACNSVSEPFYKFICSFRDDDDFRAERIDLNDNIYIEDFFTYADAEDLSIDDNFAFYEDSWVIDIDEETSEPVFSSYSASWFNVGKNKVCYARGEACDDGSIDAVVIYVFEFKGDKWYLINYFEHRSYYDGDDEQQDDEETDDDEVEVLLEEEDDEEEDDEE